MFRTKLIEKLYNSQMSVSAVSLTSLSLLTVSILCDVIHSSAKGRRLGYVLLVSVRLSVCLLGYVKG